MDAPPPVVDESIVIAAPPARIWQAMTDTESRARWWGHLDLDPTPGGRFEEVWTAHDGSLVRTRGVVLEMVAVERLRLSWADEDWPESTDVELTLAAMDDRSTVVAVRHSGWERLADARRLADEHAAGWAMHLRNLRTFMECEPA